MAQGNLPVVLDATPGLGQDAFVLAGLGCRVHMVERSPILVALLRDGLRRAAAVPELRPIVTERITLREGDSARAMVQGDIQPPADVVYLDPMYPKKTKSALAGKAMRRLRSVVGPDDDAAQLLAVALKYARNRVVVKRPRRAPPLGGIRPSHAIPGQTTRFDVYPTGGRNRKNVR